MRCCGSAEPRGQTRGDEDADSVHAAGCRRPRPNLVIYRGRQSGRRRPGGEGGSCHLSPACETSPDRNQAAGHHAITGAILDGYEIPQLCDRLPSGDCPVAGGGGAARKARPERGFAKPALRGNENSPKQNQKMAENGAPTHLALRHYHQSTLALLDFPPGRLHTASANEPMRVRRFQHEARALPVSSFHLRNPLERSRTRCGQW